MKEFDEYQDFADTTDVYPNDKFNIGYKALGLVGEAGEVANKIKKIYRDKNGNFNVTDEVEIAKELGDCLWYISRIAAAIGFELSDIAKLNVDKLSKRKTEGKLHGSGDDADKSSINKQIEDLEKDVWYIVDEIHRLGDRCTVKTDSINACLPIDNESIIDAVMNYSKVVDGVCKTLLGVGGNNDECREILRRTIEDHIDYWYRVQKDGGQTKLDM